jgi:hypothetical protein
MRNLMEDLREDFVKNLMQRGVVLLAVCLFLTSYGAFGQQNIGQQTTYKADSLRAATLKKIQEKEERLRAFKKRIGFGGNVLATFSPVMIEVAPTVSFQVSKRFRPSVGVVFNYFKPTPKDLFRPESVAYGFKTNAQYQLLKYIQLQAEYELLHISSQNKTISTESIWQHNPQIGGGLRLPLGALQLNVVALYNFNYQANYSLYPSPWKVQFGLQINNIVSK